MSGTVGDNTARASGVIASAGGGGIIAQIVYTTYETSQSVSAASWTALTGVTATLTPSSASNKVFISAGIHGYFSSSNKGWKINMQRAISGGATTDVWTEGNQKATYGGGTSFSLRTPVAFLDSPSTTSATTYQFQVWTDGGETVDFNSYGPSYITIMEVTV
jgi:hypothetical protein